MLSSCFPVPAQFNGQLFYMLKMVLKLISNNHVCPFSDNVCPFSNNEMNRQYGFKWYICHLNKGVKS